MTPAVQNRRDGRLAAKQYDSYAAIRRHMEEIWEMVKPIKFPARRRRDDRELPKAA